MQDWGQRLFVYPAADGAFKSAVENSLLEIGGRPVENAGVVAAAEALLKVYYPLAKLQPHDDHPASGLNAWDAFRDDAVLDGELVRRARAGSANAIGQLYDRHQRLAYGVAVMTAGPGDDALYAADQAFRTVIFGQADERAVHVSLAVAARDAALRMCDPSADGATSQAELQRSVLQLARAHRLSGKEIAAVLRLDVREVRLLANSALRALIDASSHDAATS